MENYSVQVPPYTVGPEAYRQIEKQFHIYGKKAVVVGGKISYLPAVLPLTVLTFSHC